MCFIPFLLIVTDSFFSPLLVCCFCICICIPCECAWCCRCNFCCCSTTWKFFFYDFVILMKNIIKNFILFFLVSCCNKQLKNFTRLSCNLVEWPSTRANKHKEQQTDNGKKKIRWMHGCVALFAYAFKHIHTHTWHSQTLSKHHRHLHIADAFEYFELISFAHRLSLLSFLSVWICNWFFFGIFLFVVRLSKWFFFIMVTTCMHSESLTI